MSPGLPNSRTPPKPPPRFAVRLARYCSSNPVALSRLEYQSDNATVTYHSDKPTGPTAGSEAVDVLEFLARVSSHILNKGQVLQRYYGWYANRTCSIRPGTATHGQASAVEAESVPPALPEVRRRWAEHRRLHYPAPSDRPDSHPPAAHRDGAPPLARAAVGLEVSPHRHLSVSRCAAASRSLGSGPAGVRTCRLVALAAPDPGHAMGSRPLIGPRMRPEAAGGPPHQVPWTVHSPSSTLGGPIEIPIPRGILRASAALTVNK